MTEVTRRTLFGLAAAAPVAVVAGCAVAEPVAPPTPKPSTAQSGVASGGATQAGVTRPDVPQDLIDVRVYTVPWSDPAAELAELGDRILRLTAGESDIVAPGDLTVTVGIGPDLLRGRHGMATLEPLPVFARESLDGSTTGGDLVLQLCASDRTVLVAAGAVLDATIAASGGSPMWSQPGFRTAQTEQGATRNVLGFTDGIINPRTPDDLAHSVWGGPDSDGIPLAGATTMVVRRLELDTRRFAAQRVGAQETIIGRSRTTGAPLSGGEMMAEVDLGKKSADGRYVIPLRSHVRAAHPAGTGRALMLRRSYSYRDGAMSGTLFISFQADPGSFVQTQYRLDEADDLSTFATCTASGIFLVLPGYGSGTALGAGFGPSEN